MSSRLNRWPAVLSRFSMADLKAEASAIGETTIWRWLGRSIRPWRHRSWICLPRKPGLDEGPASRRASCDEKTSIRRGGGKPVCRFQRRAGRCGSSTNTNAVLCGAYLATSIRAHIFGGRAFTTASSRSSVWSRRSLNRTAPLPECSGSWTTVPRPFPLPFIRQSMPVGVEIYFSVISGRF